jgi:hypothetical protein
MTDLIDKTRWGNSFSKKKYVYEKVRCTQCNWKGKRGFRVGWQACPSCLASADYIEFVNEEHRLEQARGAQWP